MKPLVPQLPVPMPHLRNQGTVYVLLRSSSCHLFSTVPCPVAATSLSLYNRSLFIFPAPVTADSWHTPRWHLHTEASQLANKLSAHSAELSSGLHLLRKASLHTGHSSVLLYYKNTRSKYFHKQLEGSKIETARCIINSRVTQRTKLIQVMVGI